MGKKVMVSEASSSMKVSKNNGKRRHRLIKVLKPKVCITDASSFKRLVQELTGNAASVPSVPSSPDLPSLLPGDHVLTSCQETASKGTAHARVLPIPLHVEDRDRHGDSRSMRAEVQAPTITYRITGSIDHHVGLVGLEELESWLLEDGDHPAVPFWESSHYHDHHQEVGIYDYGFSGMS